MSNRAIAHRLGVTEKAIRKVVGVLEPDASAQLALAGIASAAAEEPAATGVPPAPSTGDDVDRAPLSGQARSGEPDHRACG
jgi:hypothetical protein